jgi:DNA-binding IscR family transcriptional regulator
LWRAVQNAVDSVVGNMTLKDLLANQIDFEINETKTYFDLSHLVDDKLNK